MSTPPSRPRLKVLVFAASLRAESLNRRLAALAARVAAESGATVDLASRRELGARIFPDMFSLAVAHKGLEGDDLADAALRARSTRASRRSCRSRKPPSTTRA